MVTLADLTAHLLWPKLLRSAALALSPSRLGLSALVLVVISAIDQGWASLFGGPSEGPFRGPLLRSLGQLAASIGALARGQVEPAAEGVLSALVATPLEPIWGGSSIRWRELIGLLIVGPLAMALFAVVQGAIARSAACEVSLGQPLAWTRSLGFALSRAGSLVGAVVGPLVLCWLLVGVLWLGGWVLLKWPVLNLVGALLYPLFLLTGLVACVLMVGFVAGLAMLGPAVACDDADAFDAVQRAFAYVIARPLHLLAYYLVLLAQGVVAFALLQFLVLMVLRLVDASAGGVTEGGVEPGWSVRASAWLIGLWKTVLLVITGSYVLSLFTCGGTMLYLVMRQLVDGQDVGELWVPREQLPGGPAPIPPSTARPPITVRLDEPAPAGLVPGASPTERAVRLAGALAEAGVQRLTLTGADGSVRMLEARQTDLPGLLAAAGPGSTLSAVEPVLRVELGATEWRWTVDTSPAGAVLRAALSRGA
jgi:hypothetical protein